MTPVPLVVTTREEADAIAASDAPLDVRTIENVHYGSIVVVDVDGAVVASVGDPQWSTFTRSTLKPFQALAFVRDGGHERYGWGTRELALLCASHSGEAMHTDIVAGMLAAADCDVTALQCGCHVPGFYAALGRSPPADATWSPLQHNCSGKHAGFLASCRLHGEPVDAYLAPASALQRRVAAAVADATGLAPDAMPTGTDGCSAPNYAMPLAALARLYARLAQGADAPRDGAALGLLCDAMTAHPELVSGTARSDATLMRLAPGDWVTKIGADGVQAIGVRSRGIGIAVKIADGSRDALCVAVVETLRQLGLVPGGTGDAATFAPWLRRDIVNGRQRRTGRLLPAYRLSRHQNA